MSTVLRREWWRVSIAAVVGGLFAGGSGSPQLAAGLSLVLLICLRQLASWDGAAPVAIALFMTLSGVYAAERVAVLSSSALVAGAVSGDVTLLEDPRANRSGPGMRVLAGFRGETVLLRLRHVPRGMWTGSIASVRGRLTEPDRAARALRANATLIADELRPAGRRGGLPGLIDSLRRNAQRTLGSGRSQTGELLSGMVLGQDAGLAATLQDDFRETSLSHLTAASGQNVALLATLDRKSVV